MTCLEKRVPLTLYRRHRKDCEASHAGGSFTGEFEEGRRGVKRCSCTIHASGTLAGTFNRKRTGCFKWDHARAVAAQWEAADNWSGSIQPREPPPAGAAVRRVTIAEVTEAFLPDPQWRNSTDDAQQAPDFIKQLRHYADANGYVCIDQFTVSDMDRFGDLGPSMACGLLDLPL